MKSKTPNCKAAAFLWCILALLCQAGQAATVTTAADDGPGSLRHAIANAAPGETITFSLNGAVRSGRGEQLRRDDDRRRHRPGPATITLTSGELLIDKDLTIAGPGAELLTIQRSTDSGTATFRMLNLQSGVVSIYGVTVANGLMGDGGGIYNAATLSLRDCVIQSNTATVRGGGVFNTGSLSMSNCLIHANLLRLAGLGHLGDGGGGLYNLGSVAGVFCGVVSNSATVAGEGGGIFNIGALALTNSAIVGNSAIAGAGGVAVAGGIYAHDGVVTLDTCTVASNTAVGNANMPINGTSGLGGGILNELGTLTLTRCTVSGNVAGNGATGYGYGGGIYNFGLALVENSTVSGNVANRSVGGGVFTGPGSGATGLDNSTVAGNTGGGLYTVIGVVAFKNTIVAQNPAGSDVATSPQVGPDFRPGKTVSLGFNVVGSTNGVIVPGLGDQFNVTAEALRLGPLQDNGGPTVTHALLCGSVAINAGDNTDAPPTDQRGFPRMMGGTIDIGAYEAGNQPGEVVNADGCSVFDLCPCGGAWKSHGEFMKCVVRATADFVTQGLMSEAERGRLISEAARSDCGRHHEPGAADNNSLKLPNTP